MEMKELTLEKFEEASEIVEKVTQETTMPRAWPMRPGWQA